MAISLLLALGSIIGAVGSKSLGELLNSSLGFFGGHFGEVPGKYIQKPGFWSLLFLCFCFHAFTIIAA